MKRPLCILVIVAAFYAGCSKEPKELKPSGPEKVSITSIAPSSGLAGTKVVIKGAHFGVNPLDNIVTFNNNPAVVFSSSADSLIVIAPANGTSGPVTVAVAGITAIGPVYTYIADPVEIADSVDVYVAAAAMGVMYWKNGEATYLEPTQNNMGGAFGIAVSDTDVYVGSYTHFNTYPSFQAAYWKNGKKTNLSSPESAGQVRVLELFGNDLYVGGSENDKPVYWKNRVKYSLPFTGGYARVNALAVNGNDVYAAGFQPGPGNEWHSVYWKNGIETVLGKDALVDIGATSITTSGNDVYVCATESGDAVYWKNGVKVTLDKYPGVDPVAANAIVLAGNSIYVVGSYRGDAVYWKDGARITLPKRGSSAVATAITFYQSDIYIGGRDGGLPVYWKNGVEVRLCCSQYGTVSAIAVTKKQ
ncbi:IPT/TIG domain-containing protein [Danxiaibacter flavus]|uniref:IPT/TIG domain-containing protein n=1 Tax=Danxiaibacter flavus TaxID=3049108 RepID=A0ABV3ZK38_9BACT|nr:IPT/TIG domain-containing protein [Chitinophagaceae bacterium DXS]